MNASYGPVPPSTELSYTPSAERTAAVGRLMAVIAHGGAFFGWFIVPLVVYLVQRKRNSYAEFHALQAMLWSLLGTAVAAATCGLAVPVFLVFHLWAAVKILRDEDYDYPVVGDFARGLLA